MSERRRYEINPSFADLFTTQEDRDEAKLEKVQMLPLKDLQPFPDHPFEVRDDEEMEKLVDSIRVHGVLMPAIARERPDGSYELVAGHRRKRACELAGLQEMPVLVREMDDDTATILMVDSNVQREHVLPSEKAKAYKMKLEAIKRQGQWPEVKQALLSGESGRGFKRKCKASPTLHPSEQPHPGTDGTGGRKQAEVQPGCGDQLPDTRGTGGFFPVY